MHGRDARLFVEHGEAAGLFSWLGENLRSERVCRDIFVRHEHERRLTAAALVWGETVKYWRKP